MKVKISSKVCRVCMQNSFGVSLSNNTFLMKKFEYVTNIMIFDEKNQELPTTICSNCKDRLSAAYDFKCQCFESEKNLRSFIQDANRKLDEKIKLSQKSLQQYEDLMIKTEIHLDESTLISLEADAAQNLIINEADDRVKENIYENLDNQSQNSSLPSYIDFDYLDEYHDIIIQHTNIKCNDITTQSINDVALLNEKMQIFICDICDQIFNGFNELKSHITDVHMRNHSEKSSKKELKCEACKRNFYSSTTHKEHLLDCSNYTTNDFSWHFTEPKTSSLSEFRKIICEECDKIFLSKQLLRNHQRVVHAEKMYFKCDLCDRDFKRQSWLNLHKKQHSRNMFNKITPTWNQPDRKYLNYDAKETMELFPNNFNNNNDNEVNLILMDN